MPYLIFAWPQRERTSVVNTADRLGVVKMVFDCLITSRDDVRLQNIMLQACSVN